MEFRMTSEKWNDKSCSDRLPYICEINGKYSILHEHIYMQSIDGLKPVLRQERSNKSFRSHIFILAWAVMIWWLR